MDDIEKRIEEFKKNEYMYWYAQSMKKVQKEYPEYDSKEILAQVAKELLPNIITERKQQLLKIAFAERLTQDEIDVFLDNWDIETVTAEEALLLAYVMNEHSEIDFGEYNGPRLKGLIQYYRFQNLELMSHFSKIVRELNKSEIVPMIIKGGAIRFMRPELPRIMGDMDIVVPHVEDWYSARKIVKKLGYDYLDVQFSVDVHLKKQPDKGILDIHQRLSFCEKTNEEFILSMITRASQQKIFNACGYLPAPEDQAFIIIMNIARNIRENSSLQGVPFAILDLKYLIQREGFSWDVVTKNVEYNNLEAFFFLATHFVNKIVPDLIPAELLQKDNYVEEVDKMVQFDKYFIDRKYDSKSMWTVWMLRKKIRHWKIFIKYPELVNVYRTISKKSHMLLKRNRENERYCR